MPEAHWDAAAGKIKDTFATYVNDHVAFKALEDSRRLSLPQRPEDYKVTNTPAWKPPPGVEFKLNPDDPGMVAARQYAQKHQISQDGFAELMDIYASVEVGSKQRIQQAHANEMAKLGANATSRLDAVTTFLKSQLGEDMARDVSKFLFTSTQVEAWEKIMATVRTQGASSYTPQHAENAPTKISDEEYAKMSFGERRAYAERFGNPTLSPSPAQANGR